MKNLLKRLLAAVLKMDLCCEIILSLLFHPLTHTHKTGIKKNVIFICAHTIWIEGPLLGLIPFHSNRSWRTHTYEIEERIDIKRETASRG